MHVLYKKADKINRDVIGAAIEFHRQMGSGLNWIDQKRQCARWARSSQLWANTAGGGLCHWRGDRFLRGYGFARCVAGRALFYTI